jgi:hypothetical protein
MSSEAFALSSMIALLLLAVILPLIPAVITYKLFPNTEVGLKGPLQGLSVRATGAFAAYVVVFLLLMPLEASFRNMIGGFLRPSWTIEADVALHDGNGEPIAGDELMTDAYVVLDPKLHRIRSGSIKIEIPGRRDRDFPYMEIKVPGWGSGGIDLAKLSGSMEKDEFEKTIRLSSPVVIRQFPGGNAPYADDQHLVPSEGGPQ